MLKRIRQWLREARCPHDRIVVWMGEARCLWRSDGKMLDGGTRTIKVICCLDCHTVTAGEGTTDE